ncbi:hypothetical protein T492DRAFT_1151427 [Pavlovales sp. CCMP2436]|nr:hypothetical protein T492DRAFT_1151427 [Pavlovales sp. CCMP2436]
MDGEHEGADDGGLPVLRLRGLSGEAAAEPPGDAAPSDLGLDRTSAAGADLAHLIPGARPEAEADGRGAEPSLLLTLRSRGSASLPSLPRLELVPRENSFQLEPRYQPSSSDTDLAHARLLSRLAAWGLRERVVEFRAIADQLWGSQHQHALVRRLALAQLREYEESYRDFIVGSSYSDYLLRMETQGAWGDNVPLQALADRLGVEVALVTSFEECEDGGAVVLVSPRQMTDGAAPVGERGGRTLWLSFFAEIHYQSIEPA